MYTAKLFVNPCNRYSMNLKYVNSPISHFSSSSIHSPLPLLLFCGDFRVRFLGRKDGGKRKKLVLLVDDLIKFSCERDDANALALLRSRLDVIFQKFVANPSEGIDALDECERCTLDVVRDVIQSSFNSSARR